MDRKVSFSGKQLELPEIYAHFTDSQQAIRDYFSAASGDGRFATYSREQIEADMEKRLSEDDTMCSFSVLACLEAAFRVDYLQRSYERKKDELSRALRAIHNEKGPRASLDKDLFEAWKVHTNFGPIIGHLRSAFHYRDWLAHGRYWEPKFGKLFDFETSYEIADQAFDKFGFLVSER
jgi:hypothetical protein